MWKYPFFKNTQKPLMSNFRTLVLEKEKPSKFSKKSEFTKFQQILSQAILWQTYKSFKTLTKPYEAFIVLSLNSCSLKLINVKDREGRSWAIWVTKVNHTRQVMWNSLRVELDTEGIRNCFSSD